MSVPFCFPLPESTDRTFSLYDTETRLQAEVEEKEHTKCPLQWRQDGPFNDVKEWCSKITQLAAKIRVCVRTKILHI